MLQTVPLKVSLYPDLNENMLNHKIALTYVNIPLDVVTVHKQTTTMSRIKHPPKYFEPLKTTKSKTDNQKQDNILNHSLS